MKTTTITLCLFIACLGQAQTVTDFLNVQNPGSIEVDAKGNFWVSYRTDGNYYLAKITPDGSFVPVLEEPFELGSFGVNDNFIWVSSAPNSRVYKYSHAGAMLDSVNIVAPEEIVLQPDGTWYLSQSNLSRVVRYSPQNDQHIAASGLPLQDNVGLAFDEQGFIYTCNRFDGNVIRINPQTGTKSIIATLPRHAPYSVGFLTYRNGYVYVASAMNCVYRADTSGMELQVFAGVEGLSGDSQGNVSTALFNEPMGLAFSVTGDTLFVSDASSNKVKAVYGVNSLGFKAISTDQRMLKLHPNPAVESIYISVDGDQVTAVEITDPNARLVRSVACNQSDEVSLDVAALSKGTYFVSVTTKKGSVVRSVFMKT